MNERMIELVNKANEDVGYTFKLEDAKQIHDLMEKFALSLIKECMFAVENHGGMCGATSSKKIKDHFGI